MADFSADRAEFSEVKKLFFFVNSLGGCGVSIIWRASDDFLLLGVSMSRLLDCCFCNFLWLV